MSLSSVPGVNYIEEKLAYSLSFAKCACDLLSVRLAHKHSDADASHRSIQSIVAQSIVQRGLLGTALLTTIVENLACLVFFYKYGMLDAFKYILPMAKLRVLAFLDSSCDYLVQKLVVIANIVTNVSRNTASGRLVMHFAVPYLQPFEAIHNGLCDIYGSDYILSTWSCIQRSSERALAPLADILDDAVAFLADKSQHSTTIWAVYMLSRTLLIINLWTTSVVLAIVSVYICDPCDDSVKIRKSPSRLSALDHPTSELETVLINDSAIPSTTHEAPSDTDSSIISTRDADDTLVLARLTEKCEEKGNEIQDYAAKAKDCFQKQMMRDESQARSNKNEGIEIKITDCSGVEEAPSSSEKQHFDNFLKHDTLSAAIKGFNKENRLSPQDRERSLFNRSVARRRSSFSGNNTLDVNLNIRPKGKARNNVAKTARESSSIDTLAEFLKKFDQIMTPKSHNDANSHASFPVHCDSNTRTPTRPAPSFQPRSAEMSTRAEDQLDLFSIAINFHEEKYNITSKLPPKNSKLYEKYTSPIADICITKKDELKIISKLPLEISQAPAKPLTPYSPPFIPRFHGMETLIRPSPSHWSPARGGAIPIITPPTSRRCGRHGMLTPNDKRQEYMTRRNLS
ncbi:hypothetical protein BDN70DRAFT_929061 [Pholiota conissans]|uniref:Uncharacterized protein n=1 Tax=Pholiota conissans TaxID=109636 RepID=A0A9P6CX63_9AGAR|nr:hypothetical protein BDN70DRAFT_929061 [Pholiota conissans]